MAGDGKISNRVVAASCAAVLAVYAAGYARTREAAEQFEEQSAERRPASRQLPATEASTEVASVAEPGSRAATASPAREAARNDAPTAIVNSAPSAAPVPVASAEPDTTAPAAPEPVAAVAPAPVAPVPAAPVAPAPAPTPAPAPAAAKPKWKDGTWHGWGTSRHGDIQAEVVIKDGKIAKSSISQCLTRYSCDVIDILDRKSTRLNSSHVALSRMPSSA